jgi:hypothetical protein
MSAVKTESIKQRIIKAIAQHGPLTVDGLMSYVKGVEKKSVHTKALELFNDHLLLRDENMVWSLAEGVSPDSIPADEESSGASAAGGTQKGAPLDPQSQFEVLLAGCGVDKTYIPTISELFRSGDVDDLKWLREVLTRHAAGFVKPAQVRLITSTWAKTRSLPFDPNEFDIAETGAGSSAREIGKETQVPLAARIAEGAGVGFKVGKDKDGDWVPLPGGMLSYQDALSSCERLMAIKAMSSGQSGEDGDEPEAGTGTKGGSKSGKQAMSFQERMMETIFNKLLDGKLDSRSGDDPQIKALVAQVQQANATIQQLKEDREQERLDRMEANIAAIASRDPWDNPAEIARARAALGVQSGAITDGSPAVQIIKDSSDKISKTADRMLSIVEQAALQQGTFRPEEKRSPEEKEKKAADLLQESQAKERARTLRQRAFNF